MINYSINEYINNTPIILDYTRDKQIMIYLILRYNKDIAEEIYNYYKMYTNIIIDYHKYIYNLLKPRSSMYEITTHVLPYYKNDILKNNHQYLKHVKNIKNKENCLRLICMIGHSDFISRTNLNLKGKCNPLSYHLYGETDNIFEKDMDFLINIEKNKISIWDKKKIIECILKIAEYLDYGVNTRWEGDWNYDIYELMFSHYKYYINLEYLCIPGYICDKNGIVYGF